MKIDRSFVADIDHDARQQTFLAGLLDLTRHLGVRTVAEGSSGPLSCASSAGSAAT